MKKIITVLLLITCTFISGCGIISESTTPDKPIKLDQSKYADLSEDLYSFDIKLEGVKYTLPASYSEFEKNGWKISDEESDAEIPLNCYLKDAFKLKKGDKVIDAYFMNDGSGTSKKAADCKIGEIAVYSTDNVSIILPNGITIGSSIDDLKAAYGEPKDTETYDDKDLKDSEIYEYTNPNIDGDVLSSSWIGVDNKKKMVTDITVTNLVY